MAIIRKKEQIKINDFVNKHDILINIGKKLMNARHIKKPYIYFCRHNYSEKILKLYPELKENNKMKKSESTIGNTWFVTTEPKTWSSTYIPDVICWYLQQSIVFECKVSRSDFLADKKKKNRLGVFFYYITSPNIINPDELRTEGLFEVPEDFCNRKIKLSEIKLIKPCIQLVNYNNYQEEINCLFYILRH